MGTFAPNAAMVRSQARASRMAKDMMAGENHEGLTLSVQDMGREAGYCIYIYNILDREYVVRQEPKWPKFLIPACPKGQKFSFTMIPAFTKETFFKASDPNEISYKVMDGRKDATTLLNPEAFPGTEWESQLASWDSPETAITGGGNNLNKWGCFWSLTEPDETEKLDAEIKLFKDIVLRHMNSLVNQAELLVAQHKVGDVTPNMHFAMDYLGKQANWHMNTDHMVSCPTCGDSVRDGIAYHKNAFGDKCIIDYERCVKLGIIKAAAEVDEDEENEAPKPKRSGRKQQQA